MDCTYLHSDQNFSDSDLEAGLPSPDGLDDEQTQTSSFGVTVPNFCNKLREQTRPLLSLSHGVPSLSKHLKENVNDKSKESKAKKRLFKGKQQPSSGVLERRYGYIPNPRWPKSFSHARPYEPVGIGEKDREGVPGVVFREKQKSKSASYERNTSEHSYQESEFPMLNISTSDRSSKYDSSLSALHSSQLEDRSNTSAIVCPSEPKFINATTPSSSGHIFNTAVDSRESPCTSTPIKQGRIMSQSTPSPVVNSVETSVYTSDSADSSQCSLKSSIISESVQNVTGNSSRMNCSISLTDRPASSSPQALDNKDSPSSYSSKQDASSLTGMMNRNKPLSDLLKPGSGNSDDKNSLSPVHLINRSSGSSLDVINASRLSSAPLDVINASQLSSTPLDVSLQSERSFLSTHSLTSTLARDQNKPVVCTSNSTSSQFTRVSPGQADQLVSPEPGQHNFHTGKSVPISKHLSTPARILNIQTEKADPELGKPRTRSRNRKYKTSDNFSNCEGIRQKHPPEFISVGSQSKLNSYSRGSNRNGSSAPRTLTLENFITPQKNPRSKNGTSSNKNDFALFQNRFVEQLSANPISPPKKVRPSPIKKLSYSQLEEAGQKNPWPGLGESKELDVAQSHCKEVQNLKQVTRMALDERGDSAWGMLVTSKCRQKIQIPQEDNQACSVTKDNSETCLLFEKSSLKSKRVQNKKDVFQDADESEDDYPEDDNNNEAKIFWMQKSVNIKHNLQSSDSKLKAYCESSDNGDESRVSTSHTSGGKQQMPNTENGNIIIADGMQHASLSQVTYKSMLRKYARQYCHYIEEHQVPNIAAELYFIIQLLTCTDVDMNILNFIDRNGQETYFRSVHNGVYFAVIVIKRLRSIFLKLGRIYLELLAACPRIQAFSPKLHTFFVHASKDKREATGNPPLIEHTTFSPQEDGIFSFPDTNNAHVFKCQRDNFYAFYRHYHDTSSVYEFRIEHQIQYVYDGCTPEQNSVVNLMHLAKLYLDHIILCCVKQTEDKVDVLKMIQSKGHDEQLFASLYDVFSETSSNSSACPLPGFSDKQIFFKDFIETMSCPAFNEHLRNLVVFRILELNATDFSSVTDLHSAVTVADDMTPLRAGRFTETVKTLCLLGKLLGYLTFSPYTSGIQNIAHDQTAGLLAMREMSPVPVPLVLILKQAFSDGRLCLTVPWVVEYLAMMDHMAPQLSVYKAVLRKLHFIQRYAWTALYKVGYQYSGLLIVSCISWLFETPAVPEGFFFSYNDSEETVARSSSSCLFQIDQQKLVCQQLLSWCCPYLEQGQVLLTLFLLKQPTPITERNVLPVSPSECSEKGISTGKLKQEVTEIEKWLGTSLGHDTEHSEKKRYTSIIDDEVVPAYVLTSLLTRKDTDDLEDLEIHLFLSSPFLKASINTAVDMLCAKITDFTHKMILKLLVFEAKTEVRMMFQGVSAGIESDAIKDTILSQANVTSNGYSEKAKESFCALCERSFTKELSDLLLFMTSNIEEHLRLSAVHIARKLIIRRLQEWANVQLGPSLFRRIIAREAVRCAKTTPKHLALYPNDFSKKLEEFLCPDLNPGFTEHEQLSELLDKALSYGVWYINALSPGVRPDDVHMVQLIQDFTDCVKKKMITMDFAFSVMSNFLMHLVIQYIVDAPQNWTQQTEDAFITLCCLCKERKLENGKISVTMSDSLKKKKRMTVKVQNLFSVCSVQWLTKSESQLETLMAYCKLVCRLVNAQLLYIETVYKTLTHSRENRNLDAQAKVMVNKVIIKVLEMLYENEEAGTKSCSQGRIFALVENLTEPLQTIPEVEWDDVLSDLAVRIKSSFGCIVKL